MWPGKKGPQNLCSLWAECFFPFFSLWEGVGAPNPKKDCKKSSFSLVAVLVLSPLPFHLPQSPLHPHLKFRNWFFCLTEWYPPIIVAAVFFI
jgi:hypothetical protein